MMTAVVLFIALMSGGGSSRYSKDLVGGDKNLIQGSMNALRKMTPISTTDEDKGEVTNIIKDGAIEVASINKDIVGELYNVTTAVVKQLSTLYKDVVKQISTVYKDVFEQISNAIKDGVAITYFNEYVDKVFKAAKDGVKEMYNIINDIIVFPNDNKDVEKVPNVSKEVDEQISYVTKDVVDNISNVTKDVVDNISNVTKDVVDNISNVTKDVVNNISNVTKDVVDNISNVTKDVVDNISNDTKDVVDNISNATKDVVDNISNATKDVVDKISYATKDVVDNISNFTKDVVDNISNVTKDVVADFSNDNKDVEKAFNVTKDAEKVPNIHVIVVEEIANVTNNVVVEVVNATQDIFSQVVNVSMDVAAAGVDTVVSLPGKVVDLVLPKEVCYGDLGCFSLHYPWLTVTRPLPAPMSPESIQTRFYLYTPIQRGRFNLSTTDTEFNLNGSDFVGSRQTFFIIHGFANSGNTTWVRDMKDAILTHHDANVILVDWGKGASMLNYLQVASNTRVVGATLVKLGNYLINQWGASASRFNVIGHSLGAHISSYMCKGIPGVARLYALDPAQTAFEGYVKEVRLDKTDASFVEVVHTSARRFFPQLGLGMIQPYGHVDFYMNGGWNQPGCKWFDQQMPNIISPADLTRFPVEELLYGITCPHSRACAFFTAAILQMNNCTFWGHREDALEVIARIESGDVWTKEVNVNKRCESVDDCSPLGLETYRYPGRGTFEVTTSADDPYCIAEKITDDSMRRFHVLT